VIFRAVFISVILLMGISTIIRLVLSTRKVHNPTLLRLFRRVGQVGSIANAVMFVGAFLFLLVGVKLPMATSR
jgi:hypothetical protein